MSRSFGASQSGHAPRSRCSPQFASSSACGLKTRGASFPLTFPREPRPFAHLAPARIGALLKSVATTAASLGAVHSLAGATQFVISNQNVAGTVGTPITPVALSVTGAQPPAGSYRVSGMLPPGLTMTNASSNGIVIGTAGTITDTPTIAGSYSISILAYEHANASGDSFGPATLRFTIAGAAASAPTITTQPQSLQLAAGVTESAVAIVTVAIEGTSQLVNVSTRGYVPAGGSLTPGFVLRGSETKSLVIRAAGPTLGSFGVSGMLTGPLLEVIPTGSATTLVSNDNWGGSSLLQTAFTRVGAFPLAAATSADASVETALPSSGMTGYIVRITSKNSTTALRSRKSTTRTTPPRRSG